MATDRDLALRYLGDCLYGAILGQAGAIRPSDLVRSLPQGMRVGVGLIRQVLEEDDRFEEIAGRFEIADHESLRTRPFGGAITTIIEEHGRPVPVALLITALARIRRGSPQYFQDLLDEFVATRDEIVYATNHVVHSDWLLLMEGEDEEQVLFYNRLDEDDDLRELWQECEERDLRKRDPGLTAANILDTFDRQIGMRQLAFLTWLHHPQIFDPVGFVEQVLERDDIVAVGGQWIGEDYVNSLHEELRGASDEIAGEGDELPEVDIAAILAKDPPATPFRLEHDDRDNIIAIVGGVEAPVGIDELIIDLLEIDPEERRFAAAAHVLDELLDEQPDLIRVSPGRYLSGEAIPEWVREIPRPLIPVETEFDEDLVVECAHLPDDLRREVLDPIYEDVCAGVELEPEEDLMADDSGEWPLPHHHYVVGTLPIRAIDAPLFADAPDLTLLLMRYGEREVYPVWLNSDLGLLFGLERWYHRHLPPSGALLGISRTDEAQTYLLEYDGDTDHELCPDEERMAELERKRERVSHRPISIHDLMIELMREHEEGISFNALWAEMNVVRRTSRVQIASMLTLYPCFLQDDSRWNVDLDSIDEPMREEYAEFIIVTEEKGDDEDPVDDESDEETGG